MNKTRERLLTIAAIGVIVLFAGDRLILTPLVQTWNARAKQIAELKQSLNKGTLLLDREQPIRERWEEMRQGALPANQSDAGDRVMKSVAQWQETSRVSLTSVKPQRRSADDYATLEYRLDASGNLATVTRFIYEVEQDPLALKIEDFEITARDNEGKELSVGLRFTALVLESERRDER